MCSRVVATLWWILFAGAAMTAIAGIGVVTLALSLERFEALMPPLVGLAAGSLLGGAVFHLLPEGAAALDDPLLVTLSTVSGSLAIAVLERVLHWHHCHRRAHDHRRPVGWLILVADGLHNVVGGLAVGGAFVLDTRVGVTAWTIAAAHEIPQELGDFGVLVHSGWSRRAAVMWNLISAVGFTLGAVIAWGASGHVDVALLVPFAAGNFAYLGVVDLLPEATTSVPAGQRHRVVAAFLIGLGLLGIAARVT